MRAAALLLAVGVMSMSVSAGAGQPERLAVVRAVRAVLAPTGTLRVGTNLGNALFTTRDASTGALRGVGIDLMAALAARLQVPLTHVVHATPGDVADAAERDTWDVAILAIEPARADRIVFSPPMTEIAATYAVARTAPFARVDDVDAPGVRIAAMARAGYELYLTRTLRRATLLRPPTFQESVTLLQRGEADAVAGLAPTLHEALDQTPGVRVMDGAFTVVNHGIGIPIAHRAGAEWVRACVDDLIRSGEIARVIAQHQVVGLRAIAP